MTIPTAQLAEETVDRLRVAVMRLSRELRLQVREESLSPSESSALASVVRLGPVRTGDLAANERVHPTMLSRTLASLEAQGLVTRTPSREDRRVSLVTSTAAGRRLVNRLRGRRSALLRELLAGLPEADVAAVVAALPALEHLAGTS
jgi:DNA-binding MarR family transcriptional regulator